MIHYEFHKNKSNNGKHYFMGEEVLIPMANTCDTQRINMFSNHLNQLVHLKSPEFPKVFTNFENQVGEYSIAYKKAKEDFVIIDKVIKNDYNYVLIIQYKDSGIYDIIDYHRSSNITEDYGLALDDCLSDKVEGDIVQKGEYLYKSPNYDEEGNFSYGVNLKALFLTYDTKTYEDGIVISESAAKKLTSYKVEKTSFSINDNDIMLNLYGDDYYYKSFPKVGELVKDKVLTAIRRKENNKVFYNFQTSKLQKIDSKDDTIIFTDGGLVTDIDIFSNVPVEQIRKKVENGNEFLAEILALYENQNRFYKELAEKLENIIPVKDKTKIVVGYREDKKTGIQTPITEIQKEIEEFKTSAAIPISKEENENKYTKELSYYWKISHEIINNKIKWRSEGKTFSNFKLRFTILKENPLLPTSKITGRYGNKGVISQIKPDDQMPTTIDGERAEIVLNPPGVIARLNLAQLREQMINFMSNNLVKKLIELKGDLYSMEEEYFHYIKKMNKEFADIIEMEYIMYSRQEKEEFFENIIRDGIFIHQPPFFDNTKLEDYAELFKDKPYLFEKQKFIGIEKPQCMGEMYFIRLKHEASNKTSVRSTGLSNMRNLPSKSVLKKEKKILVSNTPIRLGEMETSNLLITKRGDLLEKLLKTHSTSIEGKEDLIEKLLTDPDPLNLDVDIPSEESINKTILKRYLNILGLDLED